MWESYTSCSKLNPLPHPTTIVTRVIPFAGRRYKEVGLWAVHRNTKVVWGHLHSKNKQTNQTANWNSMKQLGSLLTLLDNSPVGSNTSWCLIPPPCQCGSRGHEVEKAKHLVVIACRSFFFSTSWQEIGITGFCDTSLPNWRRPPSELETPRCTKVNHASKRRSKIASHIKVSWGSSMYFLYRYQIYYTNPGIR